MITEAEIDALEQKAKFFKRADEIALVSLARFGLKAKVFLEEHGAYTDELFKREVGRTPHISPFRPRLEAEVVATAELLSEARALEGKRR